MQVPQDGCHLLPERLDVDRERHGKGPLRRGRALRAGPLLRGKLLPAKATSR